MARISSENRRSDRRRDFVCSGEDLPEAIFAGESC
jgi:hypothetical protein